MPPAVGADLPSPRPAACSNLTGICATGYLSMCGPLRARASLYIASLSSFSYISSMVLSPDALASGYAISGKIFGGARTSFAYICSPDLRHLTVSSNATSVAIPSLRAPTVRGTAASRSAAHQLQQPSVIDGQARAVPFARANRTETRVRKLLVLRCCCAALPPTRPVIQGIQGYPPLWAPSPFRLGRPCVVPLLFLIQRLLWTSRWCDGGDSAEPHRKRLGWLGQGRSEAKQPTQHQATAHYVNQPRYASDLGSG